MAQRHLVERAKALGKEFGRLVEDGSKPNSDTEDYLKYKLDMLYQHSVFISSEDEPIHKIVSNLKKVFEIICEMRDSSTTYQAQSKLTGDPGRPKIEITQAQLEYFLEKRFTCPDIAKMLSVSVRTVRRRLEEYVISSSRSFDNISDDDLSKVIAEILKTWPRSGYRMVEGCLRARRYKIQQIRVRKLMRFLDPEGTVERWQNTIKRRVYSVSGPNALWHIDGNHKLIRQVLSVHVKYILYFIT